MTDVSKMPVMKRRCKTCPFNEDGCQELRRRIEARSMNVTQTCHSTGVALSPPRKDTHICRGARDYQLNIFFGIGLLEEPTDEAWNDARKRLGV